jgi:hypothetical protein
MTTQRYRGSCHCGAIRFSFEAAPVTRGLRCNCSFCARRGTVMLPQAVPQAQFHIEAQAGALGLYQFGQKKAKHYFCTTCGILPFHESARQPGHFRPNLGCVEGVDTFALEIGVFDGKSLP